MAHVWFCCKEEINSLQVKTSRKSLMSRLQKQTQNSCQAYLSSNRRSEQCKQHSVCFWELRRDWSTGRGICSVPENKNYKNVGFFSCFNVCVSLLWEKMLQRWGLSYPRSTSVSGRNYSVKVFLRRLQRFQLRGAFKQLQSRHVHMSHLLYLTHVEIGNDASWFSISLLLEDIFWPSAASLVTWWLGRINQKVSTKPSWLVNVGWPTCS